MSERRPNLLFIMADQLRHDWISCAGSHQVSTPNIDSIAEEGVRFTQCITPSPICAPARISLATGLLPHRLGALTNNDYLPLSVPTYYQRLRDHGYQVGCVGKLDLAKADSYNGLKGDRPRTFAWGFTHPVEAEGKSHAGSSPTPIGPYTKWLQERGLLERFHRDYTVTRKQEPRIERAAGDSVLPAEAFEDIWIGRWSSEWLDNRDGDFPWHLFVSFVGPHNPFDPPTDYADQYRNDAMPGAIPPETAGKPLWIRKKQIKASAEQIAVTRRQYSAAVHAIDDAVGRILDTLKRRGWMRNTYIVFSSDHGEMLGDHGIYGKHVAYEGSVRVPLLFAGPEIPKALISDALVELEDVNPTLCDLAGIPALENIDARSLKPILGGSASRHRAETVSMELNYRSLRTAEWKLIENLNDRDELYNLRKDPDELVNLSGEDRDDEHVLRERLSLRLVEGEALRG